MKKTSRRQMMGWGLVLCVVMLGIAIACVGGGGGGGGTFLLGSQHYGGTQSPGDFWSWTINRIGGTFSATNETTGFTYSGSVEVLPSLFLKLTVTATTEPGLAVPAVAYGLEFPGTALLVKPAGSDTDVIVCASKGNALSAGTHNYNWVEIPGTTWGSTSSSAYGTATLTASAGGVFDAAIAAYYLDGTFRFNEEGTGYTFSDGVITRSGGPEKILATPSGVFIIDEGSSTGDTAGTIGVEAPSTNVILSDVTLAGREFRGVVFEKGSSGEDTKAVYARPNGSGGLDGGSYTDVETGAEEPSGVTLTFTTQSSPGIVLGTLTDDGGPHDFVFIVNQINGKYFIFGISAYLEVTKPGSSEGAGLETPVPGEVP